VSGSQRVRQEACAASHTHTETAPTLTHTHTSTQIHSRTHTHTHTAILWNGCCACVAHSRRIKGTRNEQEKITWFIFNIIFIAAAARDEQQQQH